MPAVPSPPKRIAMCVPLTNFDAPKAKNGVRAGYFFSRTKIDVYLADRFRVDDAPNQVNPGLITLLTLSVRGVGSLQYGMRSSVAMVCGRGIPAAVVMVENKMLALVADDVG